MTVELEQTNRERTRKDTLSVKAAKVFRLVVVLWPTSTTAQAAEIVRISKKDNLDITNMRVALLHDDNELKKLAEDAKRAHRKKNVHTNTRITSFAIANVANRVFSDAQEMSILDDEDLDRISALYPRTRIRKCNFIKNLFTERRNRRLEPETYQLLANELIRRRRLAAQLH